MDEDKLAAYQTLYECLMTVSKLLAPFAPFFADRIYCDMGGELDSVHLEKFPVANLSLVNADLEQRMEIAQRITTIVLSLRKKEGLAVKQPLQTLMIPPVDEAQRIAIESVKQIFLQEVNVKEVKFVEGQGILVKKVKCNFRTMGKKFGKLMKSIAAQMASLSQDQIAQLETEGSIKLDIEGEEAVVDASDVEIISEDIPGWLVSNEGNLTVALEIELTDELLNEGMARELINRIQNIRKESGLEITDRVAVTVASNEQTDKAIAEYADYIKTQVQADELNIGVNDGEAVDFDDFTLNIKVEKI
jgi:isoleucyl-tRNA synthetase